MATPRSSSSTNGRKTGVKAKAAPTQPRTHAAAAPRPRKTTAPPRARVAPALGAAGTATQDGMEHSLKGLLSIEAEVVTLVRQAVAGNLRAGTAGAKELMAVVRDVVAGAIQATEKAGTTLSVSIKGVARGVVLGANDVRADVYKAASETVKLAVKHGSKVRADIDLVVRHALDGIAQAMAETGGDVAQVVKVVVAGARRAVQRAGSVAAGSSSRTFKAIDNGLEHIGTRAPKARSAGLRTGKAKRVAASAAR